MLGKKCLIFKETKTQALAFNYADKYAYETLIKGNTSIENLIKLCGTITYSAIFLIPDFDLWNNRKYTLENICYYVPGLLKLPLHDILENLSDICFKDKDIKQALYNILHESLFPEAISLLGLNTKDVYAALLYNYLALTNNSDKLQTVKNMFDDTECHVMSLYIYFEREVMNCGEDLFKN